MTTHRLLEVEYRQGQEVVVRFRPCLLKGVPRSSIRHWRNANREFLLAIRSLLDGVIEQVTPPDPEEDEKRGHRRQRVEVKEVKEEEGST